MKKVLALALAGLLTACSSSSTDETPKDNNSCTDTCNNAFAGLTVTDGTVACDEYAPALYESGTVSCSDTCEADLTACVEKSSPAAGEFQSCSASVPCQEGLECAENPIEAGKFACLTPCTDDASCTGSVCVGFTETSAYCMQNTAQRDQECFSNFKVCADEAATCTFTDFDDNDNATGFRCKIECEAATLGEAGAAPVVKLAFQVDSSTPFRPLTVLILQLNKLTGYLAKTTTARATQLKVSSVSLLPLVASAPVREHGVVTL